MTNKRAGENSPLLFPINTFGDKFKIGRESNPSRPPLKVRGGIYEGLMNKGLHSNR